jgi:hypothetical protein
MSLDAIAYLFQTYWIFLVIALLIGIATGWYGTPDSHD